MAMTTPVTVEITKEQLRELRRLSGKILTFDEIDDAVHWVISRETIAREGELIRDEAYWKERRDTVKVIGMQAAEGTKDAREARSVETEKYQEANEKYLDALSALASHKARVRACQMIRDIYQTNSANTRKPL